MMKKLFLLLLIIAAWNGCAPPSLQKNGGTRITLETNVGNLLRDFIQPGDSIAFIVLAETQHEYDHQEKPFLDLYFSKLDKAAPNSIAASHFIADGLKSAASLNECKLYFDKKLAESVENIWINQKKRLNAFGVIEPGFLKGSKAEQFTIEIPGEYDMIRMRALLQSTARLEFWETIDVKEVYPLFNKLNTLLKEQLYPDLTDTIPLAEKKESKGTTLKEQLHYEKTKNDPEIERQKKMNPLFAVLYLPFHYNEQGQPVALTPGPMVGYVNMIDTAKVNAYLTSPTAKALFGPFTRFLWNYKPVADSVFSLVAIRTARGGKAQLSGNMITDAHKEFESGMTSPHISLSMNKESSWNWKKMTRENIGKSIAMVVDDHVYSYPTVQGEIPNGTSSITGAFTIEEADDLVNILKTGYLPMEVKIIKEEKVLPGGK
jgi:SecD/SecF fusion protein